MDLSVYVGIISSLLAILGTFYAIAKYYINRHSNNIKQEIAKEKLVSIQNSFNTIVGKLSSDNMSEKIASAILLRRFFDKDSEFGVDNTAPFSSSAINVIAAILRYEKTSDFQKILGDSLKHCPKLQSIDFQRTNLKNVYFSSNNDIPIDISESDFYGADLSHASLRNIIAKKCQFYESRLCNTVFRNANLTKANFMYSDLDGSNFEDAILTEANFQNAINIPTNISEHLDKEGIYRDKCPEETYNSSKSKSIFIATPGTVTNNQKMILDYVITRIKSFNLETITLPREKYQYFGISNEIKRKIQTSDGVIVLGFCDIKIKEGIYRDNTEEEKVLKDINIISPWIHTEIGIAIGSSKSVLLIQEKEDEINEGTFEKDINESGVEKLIFKHMEIDKDLLNWCNKL